MSKNIIYQMLPRLWGDGRFSDCDAKTFEYLRSLGVSYVWYTGVLRHATLLDERGCTPSHPQIVKGRAGSPFAVTDMFDVDPWLADDPARRMEEFEDLVRRTHEAGLKVLIDFVPNHVAREYGRFSPMPTVDGRDALGHPVLGACDDTSVHWKAENDFFYNPGEELHIGNEDWVVGELGIKPFHEFPAKATGNCYSSKPSADDWYETVKLNYCDFHTPTWDKVHEALRFWAMKGVDGFRCDMVELVPPSFLTWVIGRIKEEFPDTLFVAEVYHKEEYRSFTYDCGFDLLYDKSGLYDSLRNIVAKNVDDSGVPVELWQSTKNITWNWQALGDLQPFMLNFLENHDEQRFASAYFAGDAHKTFAALGVSLALNDASFMVYFGEELGERGEPHDGRTSIFDIRKGRRINDLYAYVHGTKTLSKPQEELLGRWRDMLRMAGTDPVVRDGGTYDLCYCNYASDGFNEHRHFAFLRAYGGRAKLFFCNFAPTAAKASVFIPEGACGLSSRTMTVAAKPFDCTVIDL